MALAPDDSRIVNDCALILLYHLHRDLDLAERWFIRAEDLARDGMERAKRDEDEALLAEQSLVLGDALTNLARLYADQGRMQEAAEHWNELRAIDPTRPELPEHAGGAPPPSPNPPQKGASGSR
jgi:tetratricopeptide (TPR) repeat protein